jgi:hypothetical protein
VENPRACLQSRPGDWFNGQLSRSLADILPFVALCLFSSWIKLPETSKNSLQVFRKHRFLCLGSYDWDSCCLGIQVTLSLHPHEPSINLDFHWRLVKLRFGHYHVRCRVRVPLNMSRSSQPLILLCSAFHDKIAKLRPTDQDTKPNTLWVGILKDNKKPSDDLVQTDCLWAKCGKVRAGWTLNFMI